MGVGCRQPGGKLEGKMRRGRVTGWRRDMVGWWAVMSISGGEVERNGRVDGAAGIQRGESERH